MGPVPRITRSMSSWIILSSAWFAINIKEIRSLWPQQELRLCLCASLSDQEPHLRWIGSSADSSFHKYGPSWNILYESNLKAEQMPGERQRVRCLCKTNTYCQQLPHFHRQLLHHQTWLRQQHLAHHRQLIDQTDLVTECHPEPAPESAPVISNGGCQLRAYVQQLKVAASQIQSYSRDIWFDCCFIGSVP